MSLKHVAHHLASKGRGTDSTLVHMSPGEVRGLQALAKAHGGSLTINPDTGLAEAGFLRNLLPALAGAGLMMIPGMQAAGAAAIVGGSTALAKGDLKAGLMAGIGAYGGAGLADGALTAGTTPGGDAALAEGAGAGGANVPVVDAPAATPVDTINTGGSAAPATQSAVNPNAPTSFSSAPADTLRETQAYSATPNNYSAFGDAPAPVDSGATMSDAAQRQASASYGEQTVAQPTGGPSGTGMGRAWENFNAKPSYGIAAIAPALDTGPKPLPEEEKYDGPLSKFEFDPDKYQSAARPRANPYYQARSYSYADGGPIERISNENEVGMNTGYPGANINQGAYATPWQTPVSRNVVTGSADVGVNPMNGEMNFAEGGVTGSGNLDLHIPLDLGGGGGQGGSQSAYGAQGGGGGMPGFASSQPPAFGGGQGAFGGMQQPQPMQQSNPFEGDDNWNNYQTQMQGMVNDFQNSDQYKNMDQLRQTMLNYQQQRMGMQKPVGMASGGSAYAQGGISTLGSYSDGGRMLKGPGDGMSDSIPAKIGSKQPARLADGEFVVPADVVSHLGNGSTDAGARQLYSMMDRIRSQRTGKKKQAPKVNPSKAMPA